MSDFNPHRVTSLVGLDRRITDTQEWPLGHFHWSDFTIPNGNPFSSFPNDAPQFISNCKPLVFAAAPYVTDSNGETFPAGTVFVIMGAGSDGTVVRPANNTTNPRTQSLSSVPTGWSVNFIYRATGIPSGATGTISLKRTTAGTVLQTIAVNGSGGPNQTQVFDSVSGIASDGISCVSSWSGGIPRYENVGMASIQSAEFWAVPDTLPAGFTARTATDNDRGGSFVNRSSLTSVTHRAYAKPNAPCAGPYVTYESKCYVTVDGQAGCPAINSLDVSLDLGANGHYNCWIDGTLQRYDYLPRAYNRSTFNVSTAWSNWPDIVIGGVHVRPPQPAYWESSLTGPGFRAATLTVGQGDTGGLDVHVTVFQDGSSIYDNTFTAASVNAGDQSVSITAFLTMPAHGTDTIITVRVYTAGGSYYTGDTIPVSVNMSVRVDIPFPFSVATRQPDGSVVVAPGGYLASKLTTPYNATPLTRLASGVTSSPAGQPIAFLPTADGWYQIKRDGVLFNGCGEDEFGWPLAKSVDRGHSGRSFYAIGTGTNIQTVAISSYTPSPTAISGGGTTITANAGNWWGWGSISFNGAGSWRVTVRMLTESMIKRGVRVGWSFSDATVLNPEGEAVWESVNILNGTGASYTATQNAPPGSPVATNAYVVGTAPTGAWASILPGTVVIWDTIGNRWRQYAPVAGAYMVNNTGASWVWYDGGEWKATTDPQVSFNVTTTGAATLGVVASAYTSERDSGTVDPKVHIAWAAA